MALDFSTIDPAYAAGRKVAETAKISAQIPGLPVLAARALVAPLAKPAMQFGRGLLGMEETTAPPSTAALTDYGREGIQRPNMPVLGVPPEETANKIIVTGQKGKGNMTFTGGPDISGGYGGEWRGAIGEHGGNPNAVSPEYFTGGPSLPLSRELSAAREAAAARGDWKAVNASYGEAAPKLAPPDLRSFPDTLQGRHDRNVALHQYELEQKQANIGVEQSIKTKEQAVAEQAAKAAMYGHTLTAQTERAKELRAEREFGQTPKQIGEELVPSDIPGLPPVVLKKFGVLNPQTGQYEQMAGTGTEPSVTAAPPEGSKSVNAQGKSIVYKGGAWMLAG